MATVAGFPYFELELTKLGAVFKPEQRQAIVTAATGAGTTDLVVVSHGWNNDMADARELYAKLLGHLASFLGNAGMKGIAIVGVLWPSKRFADADLIPGGGAAGLGNDSGTGDTGGTGGAAGLGDDGFTGAGGASGAGGAAVSDEGLRHKLESLKGAFDGSEFVAFEEAKRLVNQLEDSPEAQRAFVDLVRSVLPRPSDLLDDASDELFRKPGDEILQALALPTAPAPAPQGEGGALGLGLDDAGGAPGTGGVGQAAFLDGLFSGIKAAASRLLNFATYYQMKERAGVVGTGLNAVLAEVRQRAPNLRIHLVGHSFGARVVTSAAKGPAAFRPSSLVLLQGAFSHNGFAEKFDGTNDGFFREVLAKHAVQGPIVVTHTKNDEAVGVAYPIASRLSGDNRLALGDENDPFGGLGRNGAIRLKGTEVVAGTLGGRQQRYSFVGGKVNNLRADAHIREHNDVANEAVANVLAQVLRPS
jgi:hypothetical protein